VEILSGPDPFLFFLAFPALFSFSSAIAVPTRAEGLIGKSLCARAMGISSRLAFFFPNAGGIPPPPPGQTENILPLLILPSLYFNNTSLLLAILSPLSRSGDESPSRRCSDGKRWFRPCFPAVAAPYMPPRRIPSPGDLHSSLGEPSGARLLLRELDHGWPLLFPFLPSRLLFFRH